MIKKKYWIPGLLSIIAIIGSGCGSTDVVATTAVKSFEALSQTAEIRSVELETGRYWQLQSSEAAIMNLGVAAEGSPDVFLDLEAAAFLNAGLNPAELPEEIFLYDSTTGRLLVLAEFGDTPLKGTDAETITLTFEQWVKGYRKSIGYHAAMDHYGLDLQNGNMVEWAKDLKTNDKDLVFVLNPEPLLEAGLNPELLEDWILAEVEVMDPQGKPVMVEKLLLFYDLQ